MSNSGIIEQSLTPRPNVNSDKILIPESKTPTYAEFLEAVKEGDLTEIVKMKLTKEMINKKDVYGRPPLYYAASNGDIGTVRHLIKKEADINLGYPTALFGAAEKGHLHVVMFLTTRGADLNKATGGKTPLGIAKVKGHREIFDHLTSKGAVKTNNTRYNPNPSGLYAFMGGRRTLRGTKKRRSTRRTRRTRRTHRRSTRGGRGVPLRPNNNITLNVYPNNGASNNGSEYYNEANSVRLQTFFDAIYSGNIQYLKDEVLDHGFDVAAMDPRDERTPIIAAIVAGNLELVKLFLTEDADPAMTLTHADMYGKTAAGYLAQATYSAQIKAAIRNELRSAV